MCNSIYYTCGEINNDYNTFGKRRAIHCLGTYTIIPTSSTCRMARDGGSQRFRLGITYPPDTYRNHYRGALL